MRYIKQPFKVLLISIRVIKYTLMININIKYIYIMSSMKSLMYSFMFATGLMFITSKFFAPSKNISVFTDKNLYNHQVSNELVYTLRNKHCRFDISSVGAGVKNIGILPSKDVLGSGIDINNSKDASFIDMPTKIIEYKNNKKVLSEDSNKYINLLRSSDKLDKTYAIKAMQLISNDKDITFGNYELVSINENEAIFKLKTSKGSIVKKFSIDENVPYILNCDISINGEFDKDFWVSSGIPEQNPTLNSILNESYYRTSDDIDPSIAKIIKTSIPKRGTSSIQETNIDWVSNTSGINSLILDMFQPRFSDCVRVSVFPNKDIHTSMISSVKQPESCYNVLSKMRTSNVKCRLIATPKSGVLLNKIDSILGEEKDYSGIADNIMLLGRVVKLIRSLIHVFKQYTGSWQASFGILLALFILLTIPLNFFSAKNLEKVKSIGGSMQVLKNLFESGQISQIEYTQRNIELIKNVWKSILASVGIPIIRILMIISIGYFFRYSYELHGVSLINNWINDLSKPDNIVFLSNLWIFKYIGISIRALPWVSGIGLKFAMSSSATSGNTAISKWQSSITSIVFGILFYNMSAGFHIFMMCNSLTTFIQPKICKKIGIAWPGELKK